MGYRLGIDLGTTFTSAAVYSSGWPVMVGLGNRAMQIPSVLFLLERGEFLVGEAAERRAPTEPSRVAREFKRRFGDPVPILVGGTPYSAQALQAVLLRWVVGQVTERQGGPPDHITLTHPANWGPFKQDLFAEMVRIADLEDVDVVTEPEAAASLYAARNVLAEGDCIAVYDLGGGTFDSAVLRKQAAGFEVLGRPEGIELGGIDFDEAVFSHVLSSLRQRGAALDDASALAAALTRLRRDCVEAKEALSSDTEATIAVTLPAVTTTTRLVRDELEEMIRPTIDSTVSAMRRVLRSAGLEASDLRAIVLTGGSSRIPLVSQLLTEAFSVPLALDTHPKHDIALGAAIHHVDPSTLTPPSTARQTFPVGPPTDPSLSDAGVTHEQPGPAAAKIPGAVAHPGQSAARGGPPDHEASVRDGPDRGAADRGGRRRRTILAAAAVAGVLAVSGVVVAITQLSTGGDPQAHGSSGTTDHPTTTAPTTPNRSTTDAPSSWNANTMLVTGQGSTQWNIYSVDLSAPEPKIKLLLTGDPGGPHQPVFRPGRSEFLFLKGDNGTPGLMYLEKINETPVPLTPPSPCLHAYRPAFSLDGKYLAMICRSSAASAGSGLYVLRLADNELSGPYSTRGNPVGDPTWTADGRIIFLQKAPGSNAKRMYSVQLESPDGGDTPLGHAAASRPDWCAGHGTLFIHNPGGGKEPGPVWVLSDQGDLTRLTHLGTEISSATWSPNCDRIVFTRQDDPKIYVVGAEGDGSQRVVELPDGFAANQPAWGLR